MSASPLRPLAHPPQRSHSNASAHAPAPLIPLISSTGEASSASSSVTAASGRNRPDQIVHRFFIKTLGLLSESRLTHYGKADSKIDRWFHLRSLELDTHRSDMHMYKHAMTAFAARPNDAAAIPPLIVAFILDTSDIPNESGLIWNRDEGKVPLDPGFMSGNGQKGKGKEETRTGIVLERWTLTAEPSGESSSGSHSGSTAFRHCTAHFRALHALMRLLPSFSLFRRLRKLNNGLRLGIKIWSLEGFNNTPEDLSEAWGIMEKGLISLDTGLDRFGPEIATSPDRVECFDLPPVQMFGASFSMGVEFRPEVDFGVENMESALSERFVDMDEDWFKPTVARHRTDEEAARVSAQPSRRISTPTAIPTTSPIPQRQQAATPGSFGNIAQVGSRPSQSRLPSSASGQVRPAIGSHGSGRWGAMIEGLPFGGPPASSSPRTDAGRDGSSPLTHSPSGAVITARRLSGQSVHRPGISSSPSTSLLHSTATSTQMGAPVVRPGSSVGRTSSFLSQSGRSFTHAQLANMSPPVGSSPPVHQPHSPASMSFSKQPLSRASSERVSYIPPSSSSPIIPGSMDKDGLAGQPPGVIKRYSSSLSQRQGRLAGSHSSGEGSLPSSSGQHSGSLLRRTSTRISQESNLRYAAAAPGPDDDDIQAFLKTLDTLPQPPSIAAQNVHTSRSYLPSTSSSLTNPSIPHSPAPLQASQYSGSSPGSANPSHLGRVPMTRMQVDDALKKMAGSFTANTNQLIESTQVSRQPTPSTTSASASNPSVGLLTASRPASSARGMRSPSGESPRPSPRRQASLKTGSPLAASPTQMPLPESPHAASEASSPAPAKRSGTHSAPLQSYASARSLPQSGSVPLSDDVPLPLRTAVPQSTGMLSPQTTGTSTATNESRQSSRRGPVLLRGGFEVRTSKQSASSSPSHSPIRDFARMSAHPPNRTHCIPSLPNRQESMSLGYGTGRRTYGQRTAPSSFGVPDLDSELDDAKPGAFAARRKKRGSEGGISPLDEENKDAMKRLGGDW